MIQETDEYSWYSIERGGRQEDGFFVDRNNRILFWPGNEPISYSLTPDVADRIIRIKTRVEMVDIIGAALLVFGAAFSSLAFKSQAVRDRFLELTHYTISLGPALIAAVASIFLLASIVRSATKKMAVREILKSCAFVEQRQRPMAQYLKPSFKIHVKSGTRYKVVLAFVLPTAIYAVYEELSSPYPGNSIIIGAVMTFVLAFYVAWVRRKRTGLQPDEIKTFGARSTRFEVSYPIKTMQDR